MTEKRKIVAIVGSRHFTDYAKFCEIVDKLLPALGGENPRIISGASPMGGVDELAEQYARERGLEFRPYPPSVGKNNPRFGEECKKRNREMARNADAVIAIPCQHSRGTRHMSSAARRLYREVRTYEVKCSR